MFKWRVTWRFADDDERTRDFDMFPVAWAFTSKLNKDPRRALYVQGPTKFLI